MKTIITIVIGIIIGAGVESVIYLATEYNPHKHKEMIAYQFKAAIDCAMVREELNEFHIETVSVFGFDLWNNYVYSCKKRSISTLWNR